MKKNKVNHKNIEIKYLSLYYIWTGWIFPLTDRDSQTEVKNNTWLNTVNKKYN